MSQQFRGKEFTFIQPDGTEFKVRGFGDQHFARFETLDGFTVVRNPHTGFYEIATLSTDGDELEPMGMKAENYDTDTLTVDKNVHINPSSAKAKGLESFHQMGGNRRCEERRQQRKMKKSFAFDAGVPHLAPPKRETVGDFVGLCLLIDFSDEPGTIPPSSVEDFCNQEGYSDFGNNGSVYDYFFESSNGLLRYKNIVTAYYRAQNPKTYYTDPAIQYGTRARQLIREALDHLSAQGFDFSQLTVDSGGYVYAMNIFYSGPVVNNWREGLWPHAWSLASSYPGGGGVRLYDYQFTAMESELSIGTFCHENGHMLCDYPDLYDYGSESSGVGVYCLMCGGNNNEKNPSQISAYLKNLSGWSSKVTPVTQGIEVSLTAGKNEFAIFRKDENEYFIIENRQKAGRDASLPGSGLAIWHIDEKGNNSNEQMTSTMHYELSLVQADNKFDLERRKWHNGDATDLFHGDLTERFAGDTEPSSNWWDGTSSNLNIREISKNGEVMHFKEGLAGEKVFETYKKDASPNLAIPDNNINGVSDSFSFSDTASISSIQVSVDITHTYRRDLRVTLYAPSGDSVVLHEREGGGADDLKRSYDANSLSALSVLLGQSIKGEWRLHVQDLASADVGVLNNWGLEIEAVAETLLILEESPGIKIPDDTPSGIERSLVATDAQGEVKKIEASVEITHTYIKDLVVSLVSPKGTRVHLHNKTGGSADDIFKTYTIQTTPELEEILGESVEGEWKLEVSDHVGQDVGKLNYWKLKIVY